MQLGTWYNFSIYKYMNSIKFWFLFQWWIKENIFKHLWKHSRRLIKCPRWIVRTLHYRSLFKRLKSYIVVVKFHFLARLKALGLKYSKAWFPWSRLSRKDSSQSCLNRPFKKYVFRKGEGVHDKSDKKQETVEGVQTEVDVTFSNVFYAQFIFNWIFDPLYLMRFW